ncbi:MAG: hypothetical protein AB7L09_15005 [Nitrospira sp.]
MVTNGVLASLKPCDVPTTVRLGFRLLGLVAGHFEHPAAQINSPFDVLEN